MPLEIKVHHGIGKKKLQIDPETFTIRGDVCNKKVQGRKNQRGEKSIQQEKKRGKTFLILERRSELPNLG